MSVYIHPIVAGIRNYYNDLLEHYPKGISIRQRLESFAKMTWQAFENDNAVILNQINNYHSKYIGKNWSEIVNIGFTKKDAYDTIAMEHGFANFDSIPNAPLDVAFEKKVDILLRGDLQKLEDCLFKHSYIIEKKSDYGHGATLLHYVGSNGVELYRQVVPYNLPELLELLIEHGADNNATMKVYGGNYKMIDLFNTSAHPKEAGMVDEMNRIYEELT